MSSCGQVCIQNGWKLNDVALTYNIERQRHVARHSSHQQLTEVFVDHEPRVLVYWKYFLEWYAKRYENREAETVTCAVCSLSAMFNIQQSVGFVDGNVSSENILEKKMKSLDSTLNHDWKFLSRGTW